MVSIPRRPSLPTVITIALWLVALVVAGVMFVTATNLARASAGDGVFPFALGPVPFFEGFSDDGRFGVRPQWGLLLLVLAPPAIGLLLLLGRARNFARTGE